MGHTVLMQVTDAIWGATNVEMGATNVSNKCHTGCDKHSMFATML